MYFCAHPVSYFVSELPVSSVVWCFSAFYCFTTIMRFWSYR